MFDRLRKHHLGFIVPIEEKKEIENRVEKKFVYDPIQGTHVLFVYDKFLRIYIEYICQEGRVAKQKLGFAHICYNLKNADELACLEEFIKENKMGYPLTDLEKSGSQECGRIKFYFIKNQGIVEFNLLGQKN